MPYRQDRFKGNFILVDRANMNTVGAGMVTHSLRRGTNVSAHVYDINREARETLKGQARFDGQFSRGNIVESKDTHSELLICSAAPAQKWWANTPLCI
jgi:sulfate adenylyltransferase subunit 1 (EFTu-like GTPase family)